MGSPKGVLKTGDVILVRYFDHVLFRNDDPRPHRPLIRETIGWVDFENDQQVRVVWDRHADNFTPEGLKQKATGLSILKSSILDLRRLNSPASKSVSGGLNK